MKISLAFTLQYMIFFIMALLLTPTKYIRFGQKLKATKIEQKLQVPVAKENTLEILHGELLFKY